MNIALVGYGKMGKTIETIAVERGHTIVSIITSKTNKKELAAMLQKADVVIEFTNPESTVENILKCFTAGVPVVCGSTGWLKDWSKIEKACKDQNGSLLYASNFSIGVNIFFELNNTNESQEFQKKLFSVLEFSFLSSGGGLFVSAEIDGGLK